MASKTCRNCVVLQGLVALPSPQAENLVPVGVRLGPVVGGVF